MSKREKNEMVLFNAILGWYDNSLESYHGIDDPIFIKKVCETTGLTKKEYNKIMLIK